MIPAEELIIQACTACRSERIRSRDDLSFTIRDDEGRLINWVVLYQPLDWHEGYSLGEKWFSEVVELTRHNAEQGVHALQFAAQKMLDPVGNGVECGFFEELARYAVAGILANQVPAKLPPEQIPVLARQAKDLYAQGLSWKEIAQRWNAEGTPLLSGKLTWHGSTIKRMVKNHAEDIPHARLFGFKLYGGAP